LPRIDSKDIIFIINVHIRSPFERRDHGTDVLNPVQEVAKIDWSKNRRQIA